MDDKISKWLQPQTAEMPEPNSLDAAIDGMIKKIKPWSEDLKEKKFYENRPWYEIRDDENFHNHILHFFHPEGEYLCSTDGTVAAGKWRYLASTNKLIIQPAKGDQQLYELAFMDETFFILKKHGHRGEERKYFFMIIEPMGKKIKLDWTTAVNVLHEQYRDTNNFYLLFGLIIIAIIAIIVVLSYL